MSSDASGFFRAKEASGRPRLSKVLASTAIISDVPEIKQLGREHDGQVHLRRNSSGFYAKTATTQHRAANHLDASDTDRNDSK